MKADIYALVDPRTDAIRYVGVAVRPKRRLWRHIDEARRGNQTWCSRWIAGLLRDGFEPVQIILEAFVDRDREKFWIAKCKADGCDLTNLTDGGGGMLGYKHRPEFIAAAIYRQHPLLPRRGLRSRGSLRGVPLPDALKAKLSVVRKGKSPEMRRRLSEALKGKPKSPEWKAAPIRGGDTSSFKEEKHRC